jgi:hypothetical protein
MKPYLLLALSGSLLIAACGGGAEQVAGIDARGNPVPSAVVSKGTITGFGSVIVNGVTYDTSSATFSIDGNTGTQPDLAVGDVVVVRGTINDDGTSATAASVTFDDAVEGSIAAIDPDTQTFTVLGQLVRVDADTSFDDSISPASLDGLSVTGVVEVSGFFLADGSISATRIEPKPAGGEVELTGIVANVAGTTFEINDLVINFGSAMLSNFPSGAPENGQRVEAKGDAPGGSGELIATRVEFKGGNLGDDGDRAELEGFITRFDSATDFDVDGVPVTTNAQTVFENGTSADLALNRKIEVEGDIDAAGLLVATKIEIKVAGFIRVESLVEDVQADQLTVLGIVITVDESTRYEDKSAAGVALFSLADISTGEYVEVRGFEDSSGVISTRLEREDFDGEVALRGFVDSVNDPDFTILGVTITTIVATAFTDIDESPLTAAEFFLQANGRLVEASGTLNGSTIIAGEVEFDD